MDTKIRQIVSKAAGIYFIVTDNSQINEIEEESRLRVVFINSPKGPVNCLVKFAGGDTSSFTTIFGKPNRSKEKKGDFGHSTCLDALSGGPIGVINLRAFDDTEDTTQIASINPNTCLNTGVKADKVPYSSLFNRNGYWTPDRDILTEKYFATDGYLNFGNIGNEDISLFVIKAKESEVSALTDQYDKTLEECSLEIDDYPNLDFNTRLSDTFVKVYVFNNTFENAHFNATYGQYFNADDTITVENLELLRQVSGVGFVGYYVGSVIPNLVSETSEAISIDEVMYTDFTKSGVLCDINNELLERNLAKNFSMVDLFGFNSMIEDFQFKPIRNLMSYIDNTLVYDSDSIIPAVPASQDENVAVTCVDALKYGVSENSLNTFVTNTNTGIRYDDFIIGEERLLRITNIELLDTITENKTYEIFDDGSSYGLPEEANIIDNQGGVFFNINSHKWQTSEDGIVWSNIEAEVMKSPDDNKLEYVNKYNNAVAYSNSIIAVAYCENEAANYVVKYQSGTVTMKKLTGIGSKNCNIINNGNIFVIYGSSGVFYSTDAENWYVSGLNEAVYIASGFGTTYRFLAIAAPSDSPFDEGFSEGFGSTYNLKYSSDGQTWNDIQSNYDDVEIDSNNMNQIIFDDTNVYIIDNDGINYISKADINNSSASWNFVEKTIVTGSGKYYPVISKDGVDSSIFSITTEDDTHQFSFSKNDSTVGEDSSIEGVANSNRSFYCKNTKKTVFVNITDNTDKNVYNIWSGTGSTSESTFTVSYVLEYQQAVYTVDGKLLVGTEGGNDFVIKVKPYSSKDEAIVKNFVLQSYKLSERQFIDGTASRQSEILDMVLDPGIRKGLKNTAGFRYIVDAFKSFVEPAYKKQFGELCSNMHENNRFVTCIGNEPFITDIRKSTNPLFKDNPGSDVINYEYFATGGNKQYSTRLLTKIDNQFMFFFGPGDVKNGVIRPLAGKISNLFYNKQNQFDIVANTTGYISEINQLEEPFDDNDRKYLEKFRYNPIVDFNGYTIFGNLSAQKAISKQQQIHNVELLCYIKEQLYNMAKSDLFKKGTYDEYLATQIEVENFMNSIALANAIEPQPIVKCDLENNTQELRNYKIKLVHVEYVPYDCIEKVIFDLNINN